MLAVAHTLAFRSVLKLPSAHREQVRSDVEVPIRLTNEPGLHAVIAAQTEAFIVVLNVAATHTEQVRSVVGEPLTAIFSPGTQLVQATHGVAASLSWSQVPIAQACFAAAPPAQ